MLNGIFFAATMLSCTLAGAQSSAPGSVMSATGGRFVFGQVSEYRRDQFLLDTQTGRLWQQVCLKWNKDDPKKCDATALEPMLFTETGTSIPGPVPK